MGNEIKPMTKKELIKRIEEYKPKYIYQRYNGEIRQFEVIDNNYLVDTKTGMSFDFRSHLMLGKVSEDLIDLIQCGDYVNGKEVINIYEAKEEAFLGYFNEKTLELKNDIYETIPTEYLVYNKDIKTIVTKEQFENISYKVKE